MSLHPRTAVMTPRAALQIALSCLVLLAFSVGSASAQRVPHVHQFDGSTDVGTVAVPGSHAYRAEEQAFVVGGAGANMWADRDAFHFVWKRLSGDFILRTRAEFLGEGQNPHRKMGLIIRSGLDADAAYVDAAVHGDGLTAMQYRRTQGAETEEVRSSVTAPDVIQLVRRGGTYTMSVARFGEPLQETTLPPGVELDLDDEVYVGLFVCSHEEGVLEKARFRNVRVSKPAPADFVPYQDYIGGTLEVLDVQTGNREVVYESPDAIQAPNWTPDGRALIYNAGGLLYRFDRERRQPEVIDTDFATQNNNDHVLSFDGTMLGISHHAMEHDGQSIVYVVPVEGGTPRQVTPEGPSYLHGWSPDGQHLVYTGERGGAFDIYRIPVAGGREVRLTEAEGLDDGSEYGPDGEYVYFNSTRSGTMELWRMRPDGSEPEQLTNDAFNNWFPHVSPDGSQIVFLSYGPHVDAADHPWYEHVYLRRMPVGGGVPEVIAYVYGGQGTINVPSWSPDGTKVGFVSNTAWMEAGE